MERLSQGVVLGAEGYLFELERRGYLKSGPYVPEVVLDRPEAVAELHREFLHAGAEVMVAFTYYGHEEKLRMIGREGDLEALNRQARAAGRRGGRATATRWWPATSATRGRTTRPTRPHRGERVRRMYHDQVAWAVEEGADFIIAETNDYLGEALIGVEVITSFDVPAVVTFASSERDHDRRRLASRRRARGSRQAGADVVGLNCSRGPADDAAAARSASETPSPARWPPSRCPTTRPPSSRRSSRFATPTAGACFRWRSIPFIVHPLRDGGVRHRRPRPRRRLHRHLLRRCAPPRARDGRGARPHGAGEPLLARPVAAPDPGRRPAEDRRALRQLARRGSIKRSQARAVAAGVAPAGNHRHPRPNRSALIGVPGPVNRAHIAPRACGWGEQMRRPDLSRRRRLVAVIALATTAVAALSGGGTAGASAMHHGYRQTNLVSDIPGRAQLTDPNLVNPWGLAAGPTTPLWVADNGTGLATLYAGGTARHPVQHRAAGVHGADGRAHRPGVQCARNGFKLRTNAGRRCRPGSSSTPRPAPSRPGRRPLRSSSTSAPS